MSTLSLPLNVIIACIMYGCALAFVYLFLLWTSLKHLPKAHHKALFLLITTALRLGLFLFCAVLFSQHHPIRFLCIVLGFAVTRLIVVGRIKTRRTK